MNIPENVKEWLINRVKTDRYKFNYISIGGGNNGPQQLPPYLLKYINKDNIRLIIIDPLMEPIPKLFENNITNYELVYEKIYIDHDDTVNVYHIYFKDSIIELITLKYRSRHIISSLEIQDIDMYVNLSLSIIENDDILLVSNYSGYNNIYLQNHISNIINSDIYHKFNSNVLLDTSYGKYLGCYPDLDNIENYPIIIEYMNNKYKIINCNDVKLDELKEYINKNNIYITDDETKYMFNKHIEHIILDKLSKFNNGLYVEFRGIKKKMFETYNGELTESDYFKQLNYDNTDDELINIYLVYEYNIIEFYNNIYIFLNIKLDTNNLINNMRYIDKYICFTEFNNCINNLSVWHHV